MERLKFRLIGLIIAPQVGAVWRAEERASEVLLAQGEDADWSTHHKLSKTFYPRWLKWVS